MMCTFVDTQKDKDTINKLIYSESFGFESQKDKNFSLMVKHPWSRSSRFES